MLPKMIVMVDYIYLADTGLPAGSKRLFFSSIAAAESHLDAETEERTLTSVKVRILRPEPEDWVDADVLKPTGWGIAGRPVRDLLSPESENATVAQNGWFPEPGEHDVVHETMKYPVSSHDPT